MSGVLLVLLGIWGGLIPLVGPYVHYAYTPNHAWRITSGRIWLEILPAGVTLLGGLILLASKFRPMALLGAFMALASGVWFAVGSSLAPLWTNSLPAQGFPVGSNITKAFEQIGYFAGLGVVIACIASIAVGRLSLVSVRDARPVDRAAPDAATSAAGEADTAPTPRWPGPRTMTMRRVASSKSGESAGSKSGTDQPVGTSSSGR